MKTFFGILARLIFGVTFIFSALTKLISPVGTGLIFKEYFAAFGLQALQPAALYAGMLLALLEFTIGVCVFLGIRIRLSSTIALVMTSFFTLLTLYLAIFNPIDDCGCFGEAIHLSNWDTFYKNLILLPCAFLVFYQRKHIVQIAPNVLEWVFMGLYALFAVSLWLASYLDVPMVEYTPYKVGTDLTEVPPVPAYETTFIYEKDGVQEKFTLENLPDDSWTFVDSETIAPEGTVDMTNDFSIYDSEDNDLTQVILASEKMVLVTAYEPDKLKEAAWGKIADFRQEVLSLGGEFMLVLSKPVQLPFDLEACYGDMKMLTTLNRSNGGAVYISDGIITEKWSKLGMPLGSLEESFAQDPEVLVLKNSISRRIHLNIVACVLFVLIFVMKYVCELVYRQKRKMALRKNKNQDSTAK
ncbi:MAG: DoxX family protein [Bacteroidales bacterium]|nr:DoxX family protein [Bacteroidales bacterium]